MPVTVDKVLEVAVKGLVDKEDSVHVVATTPVDNTVLCVIHADPNDIGKVLGKNGSTLELLRNLAKKVAAAKRMKVLVEINDPKGR